LVQKTFAPSTGVAPKICSPGLEAPNGLSLARNDAFATIARSMLLTCPFASAPETISDPLDSGALPSPVVCIIPGTPEAAADSTPPQVFGTFRIKAFVPPPLAGSSPQPDDQVNSSSPSGRSPAFAGAVSSGCAGTKPSTCVDGLHSGSTSGQPSGSDRFRVLRLDRLQTSDLRRLFRSSARPAAVHPACAERPFLWLGRQPTSDSHRCRPLVRLAASSGLRRMLPLLPDWLRLRFASAASPSGFTGREPLSLRRVAPFPAEPLMHSWFQLNLASPAEPSMSILFPLALASSGITQLNNFRLAPSFASSGASSDPSAACASGFTLCPD